MTIYVDTLFKVIATSHWAYQVGQRNGHLWCHMMSYDLEALHAFAARLGLKRSWFQQDHYDLTPGRRVRAIEMGAVEATTRELILIRRALRARSS